MERRGRWYLALAIAVAIFVSALPAGWGTAHGQTAPAPPRPATPIPGQPPSPGLPPMPLPTSLPLATPIPVSPAPDLPAPALPSPTASGASATPRSGGAVAPLPTRPPEPTVETARAGLAMEVPAGAGKAAVLSTPADAELRLSLVVPTGDRPLLVRIEPRRPSVVVVPLPDRLRPARLFQIDVFDRSSGRQRADHPVPLRLVVRYDARDLAVAGGDPHALAIVRQDTDAGEWRALPSYVDPEQRTVTADLSHTSLFALAGLDPAPPAAAEAVSTAVLPKGLPATGRVAEPMPIPVGIQAVGLLLGAAAALALFLTRRSA